MVKECRQCHQVKNAEDFSPERANRDGLKSYCKPCMAERKRSWRNANHDRALAQEAARRISNPRPRKPRRTPERGTAEWELRSRYAKRVTASRWHAKEMSAAVNDLRLQDWLAVLDEHQGRCHYCGSTEDIQIEHVIPLWNHGDNTRSNVVPACAACNHRKKRRSVEQFLNNRCWNDHEMTPENTYTYPDGIKTACRECRRLSLARYRERKRREKEGRK